MEYASIQATQKAYNYIKWRSDRDVIPESWVLEAIIEESKARDPIWQRDHADAEPAPQAADEAVPMVPEADLDAAVALADETEGELRQRLAEQERELETLQQAVLAFAHPLGVARNLAPLEALHTAQRALKAQAETARCEAQLRQQEIADRDRALAELNPAELAEARRRIEELTREVGAATPFGGLPCLPRVVS